MLTTLKTPSVTKWTWSGAGYVSKSAGEKQTTAPKPSLVFLRARYYDPTTGELISRDPLEYVDGMSLYRGYFALKTVDPSGKKCKEECSVSGKSHTPPKEADTGMFTPVDSDGKPSGRSTFQYFVEFRSTYNFRKPCKCCEFRQYVRTTKTKIILVKPDGTEFDYVPIMCQLGMLPGCIAAPPGGLPFPEEFAEDCTLGGDCYGHRDGVQKPYDLYDFPKHRPTGCFYEMDDKPQFNLTKFAELAASGKPAEDLHLYKLKVEAELTFLQNIIDVCNSNSVKHSRMFDAVFPEKEWTLKEILEKK